MAFLNMAARIARNLAAAWRRVLAVACTCATAGLVHAAAVPSAAPDQLKAVFLFNFTQFVTWPPAAWAADESPLVIGVLGENPFGSALDEAVRGEKVGRHPLVVRHLRAIEEGGACHVLFISRSESTRLEAIVARLAGHSVLTVGDIPAFCARGGAIEMSTESNRVRLTVNLAAAQAAGLTLSSKLLRVAEVFSRGDAP